MSRDVPKMRLGRKRWVTCVWSKLDNSVLSETNLKLRGDEMFDEVGGGVSSIDRVSIF